VCAAEIVKDAANAEGINDAARKIFLRKKAAKGTYNNPIKGLKHHLHESSHHQLHLYRRLTSATGNLEAVSRRRHHHSSSKLAREYRLYEKVVLM